MKMLVLLVTWTVLLSTYTSAQTLNVPPKIVVPEKATTEYVDNVMKVLQCNATGTPTPRYRWLFNGRPIENDDIVVNKENGTLIIGMFTRREEGDYQCIAENEMAPSIMAVTMSSIITLIKVVQQKWPRTETEAPIVETAGNPLSLTCDNPPECQPPPLFSWYLAQGEQTRGQVTEDDRLYVDDKGTLHFMYLREDDVNGNLRYKCAIYNSVRAVIQLGGEKNLEKIKPNLGSSQPKPKMLYHTGKAQFLRSKNAYLECVISGNPVPTVLWYDKQGRRISPSDKYTIPDSKGRKLIIKDLRASDVGMYRCEGDSATPVKATIWLDVISGPIWEESLQSQVVAEGKDAVFSCKAGTLYGDTELDPPIWYRNGKQLPVKNTGKYEFSDNARILTVKSLVKPKDIQCFQCNVQNDVGSEFASACLTVIEPITVIEQPELEQEITKGEMVNLTVIGTTDPAFTLDYTWTFKNKTYQTVPPHVTYDSDTGVTFINTSALSEDEYKSINGTYYCLLSHPHDRKTVAISVILTELPVIAPVVTATVDLWWIALIVALIILLIVIILIVVICNRKRQEGTYPLDKKERANDIDPEKDLVDSGFHDLSRAPGEDDYPSKKTSRINPNFDYGDDMDMGDDDESLMEYGGADFDTTKFNEDGSFIGQYMSKSKVPEVKQSPQSLNHHATESQI